MQSIAQTTVEFEPGFLPEPLAELRQPAGQVFSQQCFKLSFCIRSCAFDQQCSELKHGAQVVGGEVADG